MDSWTLSYWEENKDRCIVLLQESNNWKTVPALDCMSDLTPYENKLVRFKCMVQDIRNPVYYPEKCEIFDTITRQTSVRSGKHRYSLCGEHEEIVLESDFQTCEVLHCVTIPGLNEWTNKEYNEHDFKSTFVDSSAINQLKRPIVSHENHTADMESINGESNKRFCSEQRTFEEKQCSQYCSMDSSRTTTNMKHTSCIVMLYDVEPNKVQLNDVIDVVGFLKSDIEVGDDTDQFYSNVPYIFAIVCAPYTITLNDSLANDRDLIMNEALQLREELWSLLCHIFLGDGIAADYMICYLMSSVFSRSIFNGHFSLNITRVPVVASGRDQYIQKLYQFISMLVPKSRYLLMTCETLCATPMTPKKDYVANELISGFLQLSPLTNLIIDETKLETGQLNETGVVNIRDLKKIIAFQTLDYDFEYYNVSFETDIPVLSFSVTKSALEMAYCLPMEADTCCIEYGVENTFEEIKEKLNQPLLKKLRKYLEIVRNLKYHVPTQIESVITSEYVRMRQESHITPTDLHDVLLIARLVSISRGRDTLCASDWEYAQNMEQTRKNRLRSLRP